jgi:hypothetical protein
MKQLAPLLLAPPLLASAAMPSLKGVAHIQRAGVPGTFYILVRQTNEE